MLRKISILLGAGLIVFAVLGIVAWFNFRIYVPEDMCAVLIKKTGQMLPAEESVATSPDQRGIQQEVLGPGRHFRDPFRWDWKLVEQKVIPAGDPATWKITTGLSPRQRDQARSGLFSFDGDFPKIGVVTRKVGKRPPDGRPVVPTASDYQGILEEVLTPGTYKINPFVYHVELYPATVIPAGFVGVVTNLFGPEPPMSVTPTSYSAPAEGEEQADMIAHVRPLAEQGFRGTVRDVLQPGIYFINPKLKKVTLVEIGFNEYSQFQLQGADHEVISFPSDTGYLIKVGVTVVWGIDPAHAAEIVNEFGNVDKVLDKVISPQLRSICRNIGSTYAARDFIQGEKRELFQKDLTVELQRICRAKNIEVLLALVREIEVHAPGGAAGAGTAMAAGEDLKRTIQQSFIAIENQITKDKQREAATVKAQLEEEKKKIDIAEETIRSETSVLVANIIAEGRKKAAEIEAQAQLEVATIQQQVAQLDAQRTEIIGRARADVEKFKKEAEAEGYMLLVKAFGSAQAYNLYTFAENFQPEQIRLFFAGEGTFWTDLSRLEEVGAARLLQPKKTDEDPKRAGQTINR